MVVSGASIAHWLTFVIESNVVFNTFVYAPWACGFYLFGGPEGRRRKRRSDRITAMPGVQGTVSVELSGSPMATFLANIRPVHGKSAPLIVIFIGLFGAPPQKYDRNSLQQNF